MLLFINFKAKSNEFFNDGLLCVQFKTKVQVQILQSKHNAIVPYRNVFHAGYVIMRQHGIAGAYQGLFATHLRNIPACALLFGEY